jgi:hypothetical protein
MRLSKVVSRSWAITIGPETMRRGTRGKTRDPMGKDSILISEQSNFDRYSKNSGSQCTMEGTVFRYAMSSAVNLKLDTNLRASSIPQKMV